jgi:hypothetical protein
MVDKISDAGNARGVRSAQVRRDAPSIAPTAREEPVQAIAPLKDAPDAPGLRLEIAPDPETGGFVYKFFDAKTGALIRQWSSEQMSELQKYAREKQLTLFDKSV